MAPPPPKLAIELAAGSVTIAFSTAAAQDLQRHLGELLTHLKAIAANNAQTPGGKGKPATYPPMEYRHVGDVFLEVFCNPNIWPSPFAAKALVTIRDERIRLSAEVELSRLLDSLDRYLAAL